MFPTKHKKNTTGCRFGEEYCRQFNNLAYCSTRAPNQRRPKNKVTPVLEISESIQYLSKKKHHTPTMALKIIMKKSCEQPKHTGDCISNHVQVNNERYKYGLPTLCRHAILDQVAQDYAQRMTTTATSSDIGTSIKGSNITKRELQENHPSVPQQSREQMLQLFAEEKEEESSKDQRRKQQEEECPISPCHQNSSVGIGRNVAVGYSVLEIHSQMMFGDGNEISSSPTSSINGSCDNDNQHKNNILNPRFKYFGMGTAKCETSGKLYLCQLFL